MTYRTPLLPRNPAPKASPRTTGTGTRGRPVTKLFTIEEVAETLNVSSRTVRRLIEFGCSTSTPAWAPCSHRRWRSRDVSRREPQRLSAGPLESHRDLICHVFWHCREYYQVVQISVTVC